MRLEKIVKTPSVKNARCNPFSISVVSLRRLSGMKNTVTRPAAATPKLTESCWAVLASELRWVWVPSALLGVVAALVRLKART